MKQRIFASLAIKLPVYLQQYSKYAWLLQAWSQARIATAVGEHDVHHV